MGSAAGLLFMPGQPVVARHKLRIHTNSFSLIVSLHCMFDGLDLGSEVPVKGEREDHANSEEYLSADPCVI